MTADVSNTGQLENWNGRQGAYWTERAERFNAGVAGYQERFLDAAAITPADHYDSATWLVTARRA
ncbi:MAG TPA: hypothetical protein VHH15_13460 [Actinophytocola sp.]|nr:hypothetical protein [Actinophytocola sp.]